MVDMPDRLVEILLEVAGERRSQDLLSVRTR
jgi:hypothetical protein